MPQHDYRLRIYEADDTSTDVLIDSGAISKLPDSFGAQRIDVLQGRGESLNWSIDIAEELTPGGSLFSSYIGDTAGHATLLQRRCTLERSTDGVSWSPVSGGRILNIQQTKTLAWNVEIGDERWISRNTMTFTKGGTTTKVYPPGAIPGASWATYQGVTVLGTVAGSGAVKRLAMNPTYPVPQQTAGLINDDVRPGLYYWDYASTQSQFRTLKLRFGASTVDYTVAGFGTAQLGLGQTFVGIGSDAELSVLWFLDPSSSLTVGTEDEFYLYMPNHPATRDMPLHIGDSYPSGGKHPFGLLKDLYDGEHQATVDPITGGAVSARTVRYSTAAMSDLVDDPSVMPSQMWPRITKPETIADAAARLVYRPTGYVPALDNTGAVKPVRVRLPDADTVPSTTSLYEFNAGNATVVPSWSHGVKDQVTAIRFNAEANTQSMLYGSTVTINQNAALDHLYLRPYTIERRSDRLDAGDVIRREIEMDLPGMRALFIAEPVADAVAADVFARYEDGPQYTALHAMPAASTVEVGDLVIINIDTFPNTYSRQLGGRVLSQVVSRAVTPGGYTFDCLHVGPDLQPIAAPVVTVDQAPAQPKHTLRVAVTGATTDTNHQIQLARSTSTPVDTAWRTVATVQGNVSVDVGELRSGSKHYARGRSFRTGRIYSSWSTGDSTSTQALSAPSALASTAQGENWAQLRWTHNEPGYRTKVGNSTGGLVANVSVDSDRYLVKFLTPATTYTFKVRHADEYGGFSAWSTNTTLTTSTAGSTAGPALGCSTPLYIAIAQGSDPITSRAS